MANQKQNPLQTFQSLLLVLNEALGVPLVSTDLIGQSYHSWARVMKMALRGSLVGAIPENSFSSYVFFRAFDRRIELPEIFYIFPKVLLVEGNGLAVEGNQ